MFYVGLRVNCFFFLVGSFCLLYQNHLNKIMNTLLRVFEFELKNFQR